MGEGTWSSAQRQEQILDLTSQPWNCPKKVFGHSGMPVYQGKGRIPPLPGAGLYPL